MEENKKKLSFDYGKKAESYNSQDPPQRLSIENGDSNFSLVA